MNKVAVLFPGTGSQYIGMGKKLCETYEIADKIFDEANRILDRDLKKMCFNGTLTELSKCENLHPVLLTISYIFYKVYIENNNIVPVVGAGHSFGEYSALVCSGAISFEDGLHIAQLRGKSIDFVKGAMTVINESDIDYVTKLCAKMNEFNNTIYLSCINSEKQFILSGTRENINTVEEVLIEDGHKIATMYYSSPIHSPMMVSVANEIEETIIKMNIKEPRFLIISNYTGQVCKDVKTIRNNLVNQLTHTVLWRDSIVTMEQLGADLYIEVGPKTVLKDLVIENRVGSEVLALDNDDDLNKFKEIISMDTSKKQVHKSSNIEKIVQCLRIAASTKNNNLTCTQEQYNYGVIEPYASLKNLRLSIEKEARDASDAELREAIAYLNRILDTKKVKQDSRSKYINLVSEIVLI